MLTLDQVLAKLKDMNLAAVSRSSGVSESTMYKLVNGGSKDISYDTVKRLSDYLESKP
jgi:DNA-binding Xre family transcriptional regulator